MTPTLPRDADEWARAWRDRLNDSPEFTAAAAGFAATVLIAIEPDESYDGDPAHLVVAVEDGECVRAAAVENDVGDSDGDPDDDYALRGPYEAWKSLLQGELDLASAVMGGPLHVEGNVLSLMRHREAFTAMVDSARAVETEFEY